ncbi:MAG: hypothetical protein ABI605_03675 [Rhizobacter sp.]
MPLAQGQAQATGGAQARTSIKSSPARKESSVAIRCALANSPELISIGINSGSSGHSYLSDHIDTSHALARLQITQRDIAAAGVSFEQAMALDCNYGETRGGLAVIAALQRRDADTSIRRALHPEPARAACAVCPNAAHMKSLACGPQMGLIGLTVHSACTCLMTDFTAPM